MKQNPSAKVLYLFTEDLNPRFSTTAEQTHTISDLSSMYAWSELVQHYWLLADIIIYVDTNWVCILLIASPLKSI